MKIIEGLNIDEEYEKLVPPTERKSLFDEDEDYESFRIFIMEQHKPYIRSSKLPFSDIELPSYIEYKKQIVLDKENACRKHIFYLKQSQKGRKDYCDAAGYYNRTSKCFILLPYSHIVNEAIEHVPYETERKGLYEGINLYITQYLTFYSPTDAASFVLGQNAGMEEWVDSRGNGLLHYFKELEEIANPPQIQAIRKNDTKVKTATLGDVLSTIQSLKKEKKPIQPPLQTQNKEQLPPNVHIVKIKEDGVCDASGYYDPESAHFYLMQGSKIALNIAPGFALSTLGKARERLLSCNCKVEDGYYVVQKESKCRSAATAACYVMGRNVTYMEWISEDGKALKDYYPERFFRKKAEQEKQTTVETPKKPSKPVVIDAIRIFKIRAKTISGRELEASGHYDNVTNKFVLMSKSTWSQEVTKSYQYTASEMLRRNMAKTSCKLMFGTYIQFKDVLCESPDQAASFVLGRNANGLEEWKDEKGKSLKDYLYSSTQE